MVSEAVVNEKSDRQAEPLRGDGQPMGSSVSPNASDCVGSADSSLHSRLPSSGAALPGPAANASRLSPLVIVALVTLYFVWGSTYLAICVAIETIPPFLMAGIRMLIAGGIVLAYGAWRGELKATPQEWLNAAIVGAFLLVGGNGLVVWAAQRLPSGLLALLVGATPIAMVIVSWLTGYEKRPSALLFLALGLGIVGLACLVLPRHSDHASRIHIPSALAAIGATIAWAVGSQFARVAPLPKSRTLAIAVEMLTGGVLLSLLGLCLGELPRLQLERMSSQSLLAFGYLIIFGSLVGYSAYIYLLEHTKPALATSYAFVNPLVAVVLGWALRAEPITLPMLAGGGLIILAVVLITIEKSRREEATMLEEPELP